MYFIQSNHCWIYITIRGEVIVNVQEKADEGFQVNGA